MRNVDVEAILVWDVALPRRREADRLRKAEGQAGDTLSRVDADHTNPVASLVAGEP